ncbi:MAG: thiamine pyrophosphate-dependent dehydrogenase E1 component subunit alpha [Sphingomonadales bacterium]|nr:thiamine pyrophosphate-dependent dehydrogenase E1 component subunit alpha [Sphingomonadales bacterium]
MAAPKTALLEDMFHKMAVARAIERVMMRHTRDERFSGWWHPGEGQEAAPIGATAALSREDYLWYQGRGSAWAIGKGMDPLPILGDLLGKMVGATRGKGGGVPHWADYSLGIMGEGATLGSVYPLAAGAALASQIRNDGRVSLADFGDGTASRGTFHESMMHAVAWKLPLIYFCENNGLLVGTRTEQVSASSDIAMLSRGYGIPGVTVDGQDAIAVYEATLEAVARARAGDGPTLIEAKVTRKHGHYAGDPQHYRDPDYLKDYRDPLDLLAARLSGNAAARIIEQADGEVAAAYDAAMAAPEPDVSVIERDLYHVA